MIIGYASVNTSAVTNVMAGAMASFGLAKIIKE
jgi:hypothetical protein